MLTTVRVPPELEALFASAEPIVARYFQHRREDPRQGTIELFGERYILVRAAALSVEFFTMVEGVLGAGREEEADEFSRNLLFDLAHAVGRSDARTFHAKMGLVEPIARLSAGPIHFAHSGWAFVDISPESRPVAGPDFYLLYDHPYSFESDAWLRAGKQRGFTVCVMNAGYSSGWCEESFGLPLVAVEVLCRARGDDCCRFIMSPPQRLQEHVERYLKRGHLAPSVHTHTIPDFFARRRAEEESRRLYERLQEQDRLKSQFIATISHELRTPLALILGLCDRLEERGDLDQVQGKDVEGVARNARLLLRQVNDLLDVAKLEAARLEPEYSTTDLAQLLRMTASYFDAVAEERGVTYVVHAPEALSARIDVDKTQQVLTNLLSNAFKFTPRGGRIRCALGAGPGAHALVSVADSGPGIPPEQRGAVFERFVTLERRDTGRFGGTGLGLAIARELVELQGGTISVTDAPEGGALFTIELPLEAPVSPEAPAAAPTPTPTAASAERARAVVEALAAPAAPAAAPPGEGALVLVVEDNRELNDFLTERLSSEYRVASAFDGQEGLELALDLRPDLILTDVMMPRLGGDELVRAVRARGELDGVPIVVLTAKADDALHLRLLEGGAQDYVMKPFSIEELRARVRNQVAMKRTRDLLRQEVATESSDLEELAAELARSRRELQTALESARLARDEAQRASAAKSDFLRLVSHELRTPVASLQLQLERLSKGRDGPPTPQQQGILRRSEAVLRRLGGLVEDLLQHARAEGGQPNVEAVPFDLAALLDDALEELRPQADRKGLRLELAWTPPAPPDRPTIRSDPRLVRLILTNLVANAVKFTASGRVLVSVAAWERELRLVVEDTGPGVSPEDQRRIFEPFVQLESLAEKHLPGVGLGLALVKQMVCALGGEVSVESRVGAGSRFTVVLPLARAGA